MHFAADRRAGLAGRADDAAAASARVRAEAGKTECQEDVGCCSGCVKLPRPARRALGLDLWPAWCAELDDRRTSDRHQTAAPDWLAGLTGRSAGAAKLGGPSIMFELLRTMQKPLPRAAKTRDSID
jgi:hypothetical protein